MAPMTRSRGVGDTFPEEHVDEDMDSGFDEDEIPSEPSVQDFLKPLQETADRVSRQVEDFASRLHRYNTTRASDDQDLWDDAAALLDDFKTLTTKRLESTASARPRSFSHRQSLGDTEAQIEKLKLEADLWGLTKALITCDSPSSISSTSDAQKNSLGGLNRYSTNSKIWNKFLDSDKTAQRHEATLAWLLDRAASTSPPIESLIQDLTLKSERGEGVWSAGPIFTQNAIKKQKRLRAWPSPLTPEHVGLGKSHKRQVDGQPIVTQLDPDAPTREDTYLEPQDEYYERAAWKACWEMLRRGRPISEIRSWWDERNEQWRSLLLNSCNPGTDAALESPWLRIINLAGNEEWATRCKALAETDAVKDPFQQAVYGLLTGDASISSMLCETIDDYAFSKFNAFLIRRYYAYLHAYRSKATGQQNYDPPKSDRDDIRRWVMTVMTAPQFNIELREPYKLVQLALIGQSLETFLVKTGRAVAQISYDEGGYGFRKLVARDQTAPVSESARLIAQDEDSVRVVAHLQLVLSTLGLLPNALETNAEQLENNIVNYIGWLQKDKKWSLLPLYASKLSKERRQRVLGEILIEVTNEKERDSQVRLLKRYEIDISEIIYGIASLATYHEMMKYKGVGFDLTAPRITERSGPGISGQTKIKTAFMGAETSEADERLCQAVEWYHFVEPAHWGFACHHISLLYKCWLYNGNFPALRELLKRVRLSNVSLAACGMNLNYAESGQDNLDGNVKLNGAENREHNLARHATTRTQLYHQSLNWLQMEQLTLALDQLEHWQDFANDCAEYRNDATRIRTLKRELAEALKETMAIVEPIFEPDFLCNSNDEREDEVMHQIRSHYLPECILAFNSVLFFAGHALSRTWLVQCMELANRVASTPNLQKAFVEGGRMRELVYAFAIDSQELLQANEQGKNRGKLGKKEKGIDMWQVSWKEDDRELDLDALD